MNKDKVIELKEKVNYLIDNNEYNLVAINGICLSRSDLETLDFYCDVLLKEGTLRGYMIFNEIKEVLDSYDIRY